MTSSNCQKFEHHFRKTQVPVCTEFPYFSKLDQANGLYTELSRRSMQDFGENLLGKACPKAEVCTSSCIGRPIPAYPELLELHPELTTLPMDEYKGKPVYLRYVTLCDSCPFATTCGKPCDTLTSFLEKDVEKDDITARGLGVVYRDDFFVSPLGNEDFSVPVEFGRRDVPWEVLTPLQKEIVELRGFWLHSWDEVSTKLNIHESNAKRYYRKAVKKLREAGISVKLRKKLTNIKF